MIIINVRRFQFFDIHYIKNANGTNAYPGCDGCVWYELYYPHGVNLGTPDKPIVHHWSNMLQPFALDGPKLKLGATEFEIKNNQANVWKWDGNRESPTIQPSFVCEDKRMGVRVHLHLVSGKIQLCPDSNVTVGEVSKVDIDG